MAENRCSEATPLVDNLLTIKAKELQAHRWKAQIIIDGIGSGSRVQLKLREAFEHALEACQIDKEDFDAAAMASQISYWISDGQSFGKFVNAMHKIDKKRTQRFMKEYFIYEMPF